MLLQMSSIFFPACSPPPALSHPTPLHGLHHIVVCVHGLCIHVLWLISSIPSHLLSSEISQSVPCMHASGFIFFVCLVFNILDDRKCLFFESETATICSQLWWVSSLVKFESGQTRFLNISHLKPFSTKLLMEKMSQLWNKTLVLNLTTLSCWPVWSVTHLSGNKQRRECGYEYDWVFKQIPSPTEFWYELGLRTEIPLLHNFG